MARDIEEFLRRAAERRKQQQAQGAPPAAGSTSRSSGEQTRRSADPPQQARRRLVIDENAGVEIVEVPETDLRSQSVADHVKSHIDTRGISEHASHLGDSISTAQQRIDKRLESKFTRDLSKLDDAPSIQSQLTTASVDAVSPLAAEIIEMFQTPGNVRKAILLREILDRPKFEFED